MNFSGSWSPNRIVGRDARDADALGRTPCWPRGASAYSQRSAHLDFCIHTFRDRNGRVSRLLLLLCVYQCGFEVGRYISLEKLIEENKERYYETLEECSRRWHEGKHDPWPYIGYLLFILHQACKVFAERVGAIQSPRGEKTSRIVTAVEAQVGPFRVADLLQTVPNVSLDMIRHVLDQLRKEGRLECLGTGRAAKWRKKETR